MSNKYIDQGFTKEAMLKKLARCSKSKKAMIEEALAILEAKTETKPEPVVEAAPVVKAAPKVEDRSAPMTGPKAKKLFRRNKAVAEEAPAKKAAAKKAPAKKTIKAKE